VTSGSIAPSLLVAMPQLLDPNFHRSVVLLVHHDGEGSFGVVLNRTTEITAERLCESIEIRWRGDPEAEICWGGPVQPQTGWVLFGEAPEMANLEDVREVAPGLHFAGSLEVLRHVAERPPGEMRLLLGYAGWGPGQLESELAEGAWLLAPAEGHVVFDVPFEEMWAYVVRSLGVEPATLVASRGVH
jgi:putative transcriptional regulator